MREKIMSIIKRMLKIGLIAVFILTIGRWAVFSLFSSVPVCPWCPYSHVIHDYYEATGISRDTLGALPVEIVEMYGEPDYIDEEYKGGNLYSERYHYGNFGIMFDSRDPATERVEDCEAVGFILYSPEMKIRYDIHVGSTRDQIIHAYRKCPTMTERYAEVNDEELGDSVYDTGISMAWENLLVFTYDENDIVTSITYYPGSRY